MELVRCSVMNLEGQMKPAHKAVCPDCKNDSFMILVIKGHNHLECTKCKTSFCQGGCE
jgi:hypothetical protein